MFSFSFFHISGPPRSAGPGRRAAHGSGVCDRSVTGSPGTGIHPADPAGGKKAPHAWHLPVPPPPPAPTPVPVVVVTPPDTGDFGVSTGMMLAMGMVGLFFVLGGGFMVVRGRNT